jgi:hypothetical protein
MGVADPFESSKAQRAGGVIAAHILRNDRAGGKSTHTIITRQGIVSEYQ